MNMKVITYLIIFIAFIKYNYAASSIYDLTVLDHQGNEVSMEKYKGKVVLVVNVASQCGYTDSTYRALARLHDILSYGDYFSVLAFPCNQFGEQEPNDASVVRAAMKENYGVEFPIFNKINVIGPNASPLFKTLIERSSVVPDWNFFKYLVSAEGEVLNAWGTTTTIEDIFEEIQAAVERAKKAKKLNADKKVEEKDAKDEL